MENLLIGCAAIAVCLAIQCVVLTVLVRGLLVLRRKKMVRPTLVAGSCLLIAVTLIILVGNLGQMLLWASVFWWLGEFETLIVAFYHSVVNFTTLGYGDVVMSEERRILGALEAANGVLMFALSASFLYAVLARIMEEGMRLQENMCSDSES